MLLSLFLSAITEDRAPSLRLSTPTVHRSTLSLPFFSYSLSSLLSAKPPKIKTPKGISQSEERNYEMKYTLNHLQISSL
jgi:hypothetical protein